MVQEFIFWLKMGLEHILDFQGYDHMLFLLVLCSRFVLKEAKPLLILITAFTVGHCATLILSTFNWVKIPSAITEFAIPITILTTAILQLIRKEQKPHYGLVFLFGLIHGLGFSTLLKSMLGSESNIIVPLLGFNFGIEMGQLLWVTGMLLINTYFQKSGRWNFERFTQGYLWLGILVATYLAVSRWPG